jgi:hypothetical protein
MRTSITRKLAAAGVAAAGAVGLVSTFGGQSHATTSPFPPGVGLGTINLPILVGNQLHKNTTALGALGLINSTVGDIFQKVQGTLNCSKVQGIVLFPQSTPSCPGSTQMPPT